MPLSDYEATFAAVLKSEVGQTIKLPSFDLVKAALIGNTVQIHDKIGEKTAEAWIEMGK